MTYFETPTNKIVDRQFPFFVCVGEAWLNEDQSFDLLCLELDIGIHDIYILEINGNMMFSFRYRADFEEFENYVLEQFPDVKQQLGKWVEDL